jgi:hypothetical protein
MRRSAVIVVRQFRATHQKDNKTTRSRKTTTQSADKKYKTEGPLGRDIFLSAIFSPRSACE